MTSTNTAWTSARPPATESPASGRCKQQRSSSEERHRPTGLSLARHKPGSASLPWRLRRAFWGGVGDPCLVWTSPPPRAWDPSVWTSPASLRSRSIRRRQCHRGESTSTHEGWESTFPVAGAVDSHASIGPAIPESIQPASQPASHRGRGHPSALGTHPLRTAECRKPSPVREHVSARTHAPSSSPAIAIVIARHRRPSAAAAAAGGPHPHHTHQPAIHPDSQRTASAWPPCVCACVRVCVCVWR